MASEMTFEALPLAAPLQQALRDKGYTSPSPIQARAIPQILDGGDLLASAQTGTGKTAAFALPLLHALQANPRRPRRLQTRVLVLTPTRELAVQVADSFKTYGRHLRYLSLCTLYGGVSLRPQIQIMRKGVDVVVATPGRLLDLHSQGCIDLSGVEHLVLDEADRMLDMGFLPDLRRILAELPDERQSLFFSATLSPEITQLAERILVEPAEIRIAPEAPTAERVDHRLCFVEQAAKLDLLTALLDTQEDAEQPQRSLVFTRTKHGADRLAKNLSRRSIEAEAIHGNKSQSARQRALEQFRRGRVSVLVATDVAARGIDVKDITLVVNYDIPNEPESYVHRIGRTARAGAAGTALTFCTRNDFQELRAIESNLGQLIPVHEEHAFHLEGVAAQRPALRSGQSGGGKKGPQQGHGYGPKRGSRGPRRPYGRGGAGNGQSRGRRGSGPRGSTRRGPASVR